MGISTPSEDNCVRNWCVNDKSTVWDWIIFSAMLNVAMSDFELNFTLRSNLCYTQLQDISKHDQNISDWPLLTQNQKNTFEEGQKRRQDFWTNFRKDLVGWRFFQFEGISSSTISDPPLTSTPGGSDGKVQLAVKNTSHLATNIHFSNKVSFLSEEDSKVA